MILSKLTAWNLGSHYLFNCYNCNSDRYLDWKRYCPEMVQYVYLYNIFYIQNCPSYTKIMHSRSNMLNLISPYMEIKALFLLFKNSMVSIQPPTNVILQQASTIHYFCHLIRATFMFSITKHIWYVYLCNKNHFDVDDLLSRIHQLHCSTLLW